MITKSVEDVKSSVKVMLIRRIKMLQMPYFYLMVDLVLHYNTKYGHVLNVLLMINVQLVLEGTT